MSLPSGKFVVRIDPGLHAELKAAASHEGLSLNEVCNRRLAAERPATDSGSVFTQIITQARRIHGRDLTALALYGSYTRGTAVASSDVDLLVVLRSECRILREAYRQWDDEPLKLQSLPVAPAIVAMPEADERVSGFWAEIATDGLPIWWADLSLQTYLVQVRTLIASGRMRRETSHGQTYWVHKKEVA